jgi:hypothetical protein
MEKREQTSADFMRAELERRLEEIIDDATTRINKRLVRQRNALGDPGYIVVNVRAAVSPLFKSTPKGLRKIVEERIIELYKEDGWEIREDEYDALRQAGYINYRNEGQYRFGFREKLK